ncbi:MAG TPA: MFS transporter [Candidatus Angelobacter sp.]|nr:MFS transporter [Candidatus Angelobacter sp.]
MTASASAAERRSIALRLSFFYVAFFLFVGVGLPFWPAWLSARGLSAAEIGFLLSLAPWMKLVGNPAATRLADATGRTRQVLVAVSFSGMAFYLLFALAHGFWPLLAVTVLASLSTGALTPLADALTLRAATSHGIDYGRVRLWGSLSFILAGAGAGWYLAGRSPDLILSLVLLTLATTVAAAMLLPDSAPAAHRVSTAGWGRLLREPGFLLFILAAGLIQSSHAVLYGFGTIHWLAAGYDKDTIGLLWAVGVVVEVVLFAAGRRLLLQIGPVGLLLVGGVAGILRWTLTGLTSALPVLFVVQALHGLTFGGTHLGAVHYIARRMPPGLAVSAQGLYGALSQGAVFGLAMLAAGALYDALAGSAFFVMAGMCVAGCAAALALLRGNRR